jgi:hypothetical protein
MEPVIVMGALALVIAGGVVGFDEWRSRKDVSTRYAAACVSSALLGVAALAYCFSLGFARGAVVVGAMIAFWQQHRIESFLVQGRGPRGTGEGADTRVARPQTPGPWRNGMRR